MIKYAVHQALRGRWGYAIGVCVLPALPLFILGMIPISLSFGMVYVNLADIYTRAFPLPLLAAATLATWLIVNPMLVKVSGYFVQLNRDPGQLPSPLSVCSCFGQGSGYFRLMRGMFVRDIIVWVAMLLPLAIGALIPGVITLAPFEDVMAYRIDTVASWLLLLGSVLGLMVSLALSMVPYILAEDPQVRTLEALRASCVITRGRLGELFVLQLSLLGWNFLTQFIGQVTGFPLYNPFIEATMAAYYIAYTQPSPLPEVQSDAAG